MTLLVDVVALVIAGGTATWLAVRWWPGRGVCDRMLQLATVGALAVAFASAALYLGLRLEVSSLGRIALACAVGAIAMAWLWRARGGSLDAPPPIRPPRSLRSLVWALLAFAITASTVGAAMHVAHEPYGWYDAWLHWNPRASLMAEHPGPWSDLGATLRSYNHPDYPLLVPGAVACGLRLVDPSSIAIAAAVAIGFTIALLLVVAAALGRARGGVVAAVGAMCTLGQDRLLAAGVDQLADVAVALFLALGFALLLAAGRRDGPPRAGLVVAAGFAIGASAWCKNEGSLLLIATAVAAVVLSRAYGFGAAIRVTMLFVVGALPWALLILAHMAALPTNNLVSAWQSGGLGRLFEPERHRIVLGAFVRMVGHWCMGLWVLLPMLAWLSARARGRRATPIVSWLALSLGLVGVGYYVVYVTTPLDLEFHLRSSLDRLALHLWPATVLVSLWHADALLFGASAATAGRRIIQG